MSYTTIFLVPRYGRITDSWDFRNSHLGASLVWSQLAMRYLHMTEEQYFRAFAGFDRKPDPMRAVWDLARNVSLPLADRIVLGSTFDYVMVRQPDLPKVVNAIRDYALRFEPGHLLEQASLLTGLASNPVCFAVCWQQTSTGTSLWQIGDRPYDINRDQKHWFLFDEAGTFSLTPRLTGEPA